MVARLQLYDPQNDDQTLLDMLKIVKLKMGHFNDLPKDVNVKLSFYNAKNFLSKRFFVTTFTLIVICSQYCRMIPLSLNELERAHFNFFDRTIQATFQHYLHWISTFALIDKQCLKVIRAKTVTIDYEAWSFVNGALIK